MANKQNIQGCFKLTLVNPTFGSPKQHLMRPLSDSLVLKSFASCVSAPRVSIDLKTVAANGSLLVKMGIAQKSTMFQNTLFTV